MSTIAEFRSFVSAAAVPSGVVLSGNHADEHTGRDGAQRDAGDHREHRQTEAPVDSSTEDESRDAGNRHRGERLIPYVLNHIAAPPRASG